MKKLQPNKLEPKSEKCVFIGYPKETIGYTCYHRSEGKIFVAKNGSFLEKEFLSKKVSVRKVELDEVIVPSLELESSSSQKTVPVMPTPTREEANDNDHETSDQVTTEPRRSTRARSAPDWYVSDHRSRQNSQGPNTGVRTEISPRPIHVLGLLRSYGLTR